MVRMKDVAEHAGVSVATVSNVITGKQPVSEDVRANVLRSIKELNYNVNLVARGLKTQRTYTIGVILPDVTKIFFLDVLKGIMDTANKAGYNISILSSNFDFGRERALVASLRSSRVDGIILDSCVDTSCAREWADELANTKAGMPPVVSIECRMDAEKVSAVLVDSQYWSGRLTQHLIDSGRRRIFFITGPLHIEHEAARLAGYRQALAANGLPRNEELVAMGDYSSGVAHGAVAAALQSGLRFDAVQASNDQAAIGTMKALMDNGITVPDDVAVCGFDNLFPSTLITPAITTVDVPRYEMGTVAMRELLRRIDDKEAAPTHYILNAGIIVRASTSPQMETTWNLENW